MNSASATKKRLRKYRFIKKVVNKLGQSYGDFGMHNSFNNTAELTPVLNTEAQIIHVQNTDNNSRIKNINFHSTLESIPIPSNYSVGEKVKFLLK